MSAARPEALEGLLFHPDPAVRAQGRELAVSLGEAVPEWLRVAGDLWGMQTAVSTLAATQNLTNPFPALHAAVNAFPERIDVETLARACIALQHYAQRENLWIGVDLETLTFAAPLAHGTLFARLNYAGEYLSLGEVGYRADPVEYIRDRGQIVGARWR